MRPIPRVSPASTCCRFRWSTAGTDGAWPIHLSAAGWHHCAAPEICLIGLPARRPPPETGSHDCTPVRKVLAAPTALTKSPWRLLNRAPHFPRLRSLAAFGRRPSVPVAAYVRGRHPKPVTRPLITHSTKTGSRLVGS